MGGEQNPGVRGVGCLGGGFFFSRARIKRDWSTNHSPPTLFCLFVCLFVLFFKFPQRAEKTDTSTQAFPNDLRVNSFPCRVPTLCLPVSICSLKGALMLSSVQFSSVQSLDRLNCRGTRGTIQQRSSLFCGRPVLAQAV